MKKIMCALLAVSLLLSAATACGGGNKSTSVPSVSSNSVSSQSNADEESSREESSEEEDSEDESSQDESSQEESSQEESSEEESSQDDTSAVFSAVSTAPANSGLDHPEDVADAYLEAFLNHDPEALYALFSVEELTFINAWLASEKGYGAYWNVHDQETLITLLDSAMYDIDWEIDDKEESTGFSARKDVSNGYYYNDDDDDWNWKESYEQAAEEVEACVLNFTPTDMYLCDAILEFGEDDEFDWVECLTDDICVVCIDGRWYLSGLMLDALSGDGF